MREYESERDKLKQHLGIEWIPNGLNESAYSDDKFISNSYDLNCNFGDVKKFRSKSIGINGD
ncbi:hypothetical protein KIN20_028629 [Parelaphostrongylus tenuis]|uniref:Uncharacterized protein n=1 Tax=Parelaphostrongylus tenuis TaxID=148309 RepID=A0AAD5WEZ3_PARTN|nr:hypothetical protein KIN20_028629 [Parelaphostrongylus tenuis]